MKHKVKGKHFNRDTQSRKALFRNSLRALIDHGHIETSESRAKEIRRLADKIISQAQKGDLASRREIHKYFGKRDVVNTLIDRVVPALGDKKTGFCSLEKQSNRRGDNMPIFRLSLLVENKDWQSLKNEENKKVTRKTSKTKQNDNKKKAIKTNKKISKSIKKAELKKKEDKKK